MNEYVIAFIVMIIVGAVLFLLGFNKKSLLIMFFGLIAILVSLLYFISWTILLPFVPPAAMGIAYTIHKRVITT